VSGAAILPHGHGALEGCVALARIEDFTESVSYRLAKLREALGAFGEIGLLGEEASEALWRAVRDAEPLAAAPGEAIWRLSVAPSAAAAACAELTQAFGAKLLLDWGGGLIWVAGPATELAHGAVIHAAGKGSFTLFRAPDALRAVVPVLPAEPPALAALAARVKAVLDPQGLLNPGRMRA
jgi:glycolate oxidase FAD binding subunit